MLCSLKSISNHIILFESKNKHPPPQPHLWCSPYFWRLSSMSLFNEVLMNLPVFFFSNNVFTPICSTKASNTDIFIEYIKEWTAHMLYIIQCCVPQIHIMKPNPQCILYLEMEPLSVDKVMRMESSLMVLVPLSKRLRRVLFCHVRLQQEK